MHCCLAWLHRGSTSKTDGECIQSFKETLQGLSLQMLYEVVF